MILILILMMEGDKIDKIVLK